MPCEMRMDAVTNFARAFKLSMPMLLIDDEGVLAALDSDEQLPALPNAINLWLKKQAMVILNVMQQTKGFLDASTEMTPTLFHYNN